MSADAVVIRTYSSPHEAQIARAILDAEGIPCLIMGDDAGGMQPALGWVRGVRLAVRHSDAVRAIAALDEVVEDAPEDDEDDDPARDDEDGAA